MIGISIEFKTDDIAEVVGRIGKAVENNALPSSINKTMKMARTATVRKVAGEFRVPVRAIKERFWIKSATRNKPVGVMSLGILPVRSGDIGKPRQSKAGARAGTYFWQGAFAARMPSGHQAVFKRRGRARLPIKETTVVISPRAENLFAEQARINMRQDFPRIFRHELQYRASRRGLI